MVPITPLTTLGYSPSRALAVVELGTWGKPVDAFVEGGVRLLP